MSRALSDLIYMALSLVTSMHLLLIYTRVRSEPGLTATELTLRIQTVLNFAVQI